MFRSKDLDLDLRSIHNFGLILKNKGFMTVPIARHPGDLHLLNTKRTIADPSYDNEIVLTS